MNVLLLTVACYGPYMAISGTIDIVQAIRRRRAERVFVVPTALIRPTARVATTNHGERIALVTSGRQASTRFHSEVPSRPPAH